MTFGLFYDFLQKIGFDGLFSTKISFYIVKIPYRKVENGKNSKTLIGRRAAHADRWLAAHSRSRSLCVLSLPLTFPRDFWIFFSRETEKCEKLAKNQRNSSKTGKIGRKSVFIRSTDTFSSKKFAENLVKNISKKTLKAKNYS